MNQEQKYGKTVLYFDDGAYRVIRWYRGEFLLRSVYGEKLRYFKPPTV